MMSLTLPKGASGATSLASGKRPGTLSSLRCSSPRAPLATKPVLSPYGGEGVQSRQGRPPHAPHARRRGRRRRASQRPGEGVARHSSPGPSALSEGKKARGTAPRKRTPRTLQEVRQPSRAPSETLSLPCLLSWLRRRCSHGLPLLRRQQVTQRYCWSVEGRVAAMSLFGGLGKTPLAGCSVPTSPAWGRHADLPCCVPVPRVVAALLLP
jgi:hypothetical protein